MTLIDVFITHNGKVFPIMRYEYIHYLNRKLHFNDVTYDIETTIPRLINKPILNKIFLLNVIT